MFKIIFIWVFSLFICSQSQSSEISKHFDERLFSLDSGKVQQAISEGADINAKNNKGQTAFLYGV